MSQIILDISNPALAPLAVRSYEKKYTHVPNRVLPEAVRSQLQEIYIRLTSRPLDAEASTLSVAADDGRYKGIYGPSLYASKDGTQFIIQWGREAIALTPQKGGTFEEVSPENLSISFASVKYGNALDVVMRLMYFDEADNAFFLDIKPRAATKETELVAETMTNLMSRNPKKVVGMLAPQPELSTFDGEQYSAGDLEEGTYQIRSYRQLTTKWGTKYMMLVEANPELGQDNPFELWSDATSSAVLSLSPKIDGEHPATVTVFGKRQTKRGTIKADQSIALAGLEYEEEMCPFIVLVASHAFFCPSEFCYKLICAQPFR